MKRRWWKIATVVGFLSTGFVVAGHGGARIRSRTRVHRCPRAALSTSGDYATDVLGDPWDFSNDEDVPPIPIIGSENGFGISRGQRCAVRRRRERHDHQARAHLGCRARMGTRRSAQADRRGDVHPPHRLSATSTTSATSACAT